MLLSQGAIGKLTLLKDKASDGIAKVRKAMGRNKNIQCRIHLKVTGKSLFYAYLLHSCTAHLMKIIWDKARGGTARTQGQQAAINMSSAAYTGQ